MSDPKTMDELLEFLDYHWISVRQTGYRGQDGYTAYVPDPGGHYQEERVREVGWGQKPSDAIREAIKHYSRRKDRR